MSKNILDNFEITLEKKKENDNNSKNNENLKEKENDMIKIDELKKEILGNAEKKNHTFIKKKRGRKNIKIHDTNKKENVHDKFSDDNLKRKVKTHYHNFIIAFLNLKSKHILSKKYSFGKISSKITQNITVEYNQKLFDKKIKDIIVQMSDKFQDKDRNKISLKIIKDKAGDNDEIVKLLNTDYKDMYHDYYLKSNNETFKGEAIDESYQAHINKLEKLYGKEYVADYKRNAQELISFFYKIKKRVRKKKFKGLLKPNLVQFANGNINYNYINLRYKNTFPLDYSNMLVSTSTQTNMIISEDEDE